jgi:anaerobic selenocysteine-containing dehydrogenase
MQIRDIVKTTCPRDCYDACGIAVIRENAAISKVVGDHDHPIARGALCGKCAIAYNGAWRDPALRLSSPLRRVGEKGKREFVAITWDQALDEIAVRFRRLVEAGAADTIVHTHYTGTVGLIAGWFPIRLFNRMGATEVDPDTVCNKAGHMALELVFGNSLEGFDPRTAKDTNTILIWGANPSHSATHQNNHWLKRAHERGTKIIVIDPIAHATAQNADIHLKLAPGSDAALAFAFINVMRSKHLVDERFLADYVVGAEELTAAIDSMTLARAAALCGVSEHLIELAAVAYAQGPSLMWLGQGVQRQAQGGNVFRALSALIAFSGNLGKPGAGFLYMNGPAMRGVDVATITIPSLAPQAIRTISHMDLAATLESSAKASAFINWNNNPATSSPEQSRLRRALERDDLFHVAVDLFHTDTTAYADIVLPAASFLEFDDIILSYFDLTISAQVKAGDPPGEALSNQEIFRRLAAAMGYQDPELFETDPELIARLLAQTPFRGSFADLARIGTATLFNEPRIQFSNLVFATPSGKIELASDYAVAHGLPRAPLPHVDPRPINGRLRVVSPASQWLLNSSYGNDPKIQKRLGPATVTLHPRDAAERGLAEGSAVVLINEIGRLPLAVAISEITQPGVAIVHKGRWPQTSPGNANINALVLGRKSDMGESTTVHGTEAELIRPRTVE